MDFVAVGIVGLLAVFGITILSVIVRIILIKLNSVKIHHDIAVGSISASGVRRNYEITVNVNNNKQYTFFVNKGKIVSYKKGTDEYKNYNA